MRRILSFFHGLRGRLTLTYTLVTVLALMALEMLVLIIGLLASSLNQTDTRDYLNDVMFTLYPEAREYLQPGKENIPGLQKWLERVHLSGYASMEPQNPFDSPRANIVQGDPMFVVNTKGMVIAQSPSASPDLVGRRYTPPDLPGAERAVQQAAKGNNDTLQLIARTSANDYFMALPIHRGNTGTETVGMLILTIEPPSPMILQVWPTMLGWIVLTGILLLMAVIPFGALFGFIMSIGLTRRLGMLTRAVDAWSEGDFRPLPLDRSGDEIGYLSMRMRHMAERVQTLLQSQQQLAMIEERNRLARELHDTVKQQTFATLMQVRAARNLMDNNSQSAREHLEDAEGLIKTTQQELSMIIAELRPAALDGQGLAGALRNYADQWSQHARIPIDVSVLNDRSLPLDVEQALYRIAQEALANVARHSRASAAVLRLAFQPQNVTLTVQDNGVGFDPSSDSTAGFGLRSMQERLAAIDGKLQIASSAGVGTTISAFVDLEKRNEFDR